MMTNWTNKEKTKRQPRTGMRGVCLQVGLSLSFINTLGDLGGHKETQSIDGRYIRQ